MSHSRQFMPHSVDLIPRPVNVFANLIQPAQSNFLLVPKFTVDLNLFKNAERAGLNTQKTRPKYRIRGKEKRGSLE